MKKIVPVALIVSVALNVILVAAIAWMKVETRRQFIEVHNFVLDKYIVSQRHVLQELESEHLDIEKLKSFVRESTMQWEDGKLNESLLR